LSEEKNMPRLSIKSLFLITTYIAFCALNYVFENVAIGWITVLATSMLMAVVMIRAFHTREVFGLGFSVFGFVWLTALLGFSIETPIGFKAYDLRSTVWKTMRLGRNVSPIEDYSKSRRSTLHYFYHSGGMMRTPDKCPPDFYNAIKLAACWSALIVGLAGGCLFALIIRPHKARGS
jgi:hypothetical protein